MATFPTFFAGIMGLGGGELIFVFAILLLLFGGAKLPSLARGLGQSIKEFKKASKEGDEPEKAEVKTVAAEPVKTKPTT